MSRRTLLSQRLAFQDRLPGGLADDKLPTDFNEKDLKEGQKVETEHVRDKNLAKEIAMDHLEENPEYYKKIKEFGL